MNHDLSWWSTCGRFGRVKLPQLPLSQGRAIQFVALWEMWVRKPCYCCTFLVAGIQLPRPWKKEYTTQVALSLLLLEYLLVVLGHNCIHIWFCCLHPFFSVARVWCRERGEYLSLPEEVAVQAWTGWLQQSFANVISKWIPKNTRYSLQFLKLIVYRSHSVCNQVSFESTPGLIGNIHCDLLRFQNRINMNQLCE